jgi:hypothetical protein
VASSKTILAIGLAAITLVVFVVVIAMGGALRAGLAPWPGIGVAVLAIAAFTVPRECRSFLVAGRLAASGVVGVVYALIWTECVRNDRVPGCPAHAGVVFPQVLLGGLFLPREEMARDWADDVRGEAIAAGHFLPEEAPETTARPLPDF